jgi:hypothetical protein
MFEQLRTSPVGFTSTFTVLKKSCPFSYPDPHIQKDTVQILLQCLTFLDLDSPRSNFSLVIRSFFNFALCCDMCS